ncbi:MAG: hypothetical protein N3F10_04085 [Candidatus Bathyarchaeota archaeon]|nr:hypothetical protein [Candidatus Bathyarchaeota archaeon]MCX8177460.1 hypothetical protein [Candidatus Bathyarchaeota archaeon]MDW8194127.1 hypothetical protein [Nitrososphaerota archaeon]
MILQEKKNETILEAEKLAKKRDELNEKVKELYTSFLELKSIKDRIKSEVRELKQQRSQIKAELIRKLEELKHLRPEIEDLCSRRPATAPYRLKKEIEKIEWKIQTTPLDLHQEKRLVERAGKLELQLSIHRKISVLRQKTLELKAEVKALSARVKSLQKQITEKVKESQNIREKMMLILEESKQVKAEADSAHELYMKAKADLKNLQLEISRIIEDMKRVKAEITAEEKITRKKAEEELLKSVEKQALEKLKRGEKLTWEEFKLIADRELTQQD